ncbi:MAG: hypothetical protein ABSA47_18055 [Verrucomicrobiota bacterium]|jgi:hypothetical protein
MENTAPLAILSAILGIGWLGYAAYAQGTIETLREIVKDLEAQNADLRKKAKL